MRLIRTFCFAAVIAAAGHTSLFSAGRLCEDLASLSLPATTVTAAKPVAPGAFVPPGNAGRGAQDAMRDLPAFCRVAATIAPTSDSDIKVEVWMPASGWNGKFLAVGNGGFAGSISYPAMADALRRGYATSSTDTGHSTPGGSFALGHPEKLIDYAWRSEHEMTVKAKAMIAAHYGEEPELSSWNGRFARCKQAVTTAQ